MNYPIIYFTVVSKTQKFFETLQMHKIPNTQTFFLYPKYESYILILLKVSVLFPNPPGAERFVPLQIVITIP